MPRTDTSLAAATKIGWDKEFTEADLERLDPMDLTHPLMIAFAWFVLFALVPNPNVGLSKTQTTSLPAVFDKNNRFPLSLPQTDPTLRAHRDRFLPYLSQDFGSTVARAFTMILWEYTAAMMHKCKGFSFWSYPHPNVMRGHGQIDDPIKIVHKNARDLLRGLGIMPVKENTFTCLVLGTIWQNSFFQRAQSLLLEEMDGPLASADDINTTTLLQGTESEMLPQHSGDSNAKSEETIHWSQVARTSTEELNSLLTWFRGKLDVSAAHDGIGSAYTTSTKQQTTGFPASPLSSLIRPEGIHRAVRPVKVVRWGQDETRIIDEGSGTQTTTSP